MQYEPGDSVRLILDHSDEFQAVGWAASEIYHASPDNPVAQSAYKSAYAATRIRHSDEKSLTLHGKKADALLSVIKQWVDAGPPERDDPITYPARAKSYRTACAIVAKTIELPPNPASVSS